MICNDCGLPFDESDLSQVFEHEHKGRNVWWSKLLRRTISNATHYRKIEELKLPLH